MSAVITERLVAVAQAARAAGHGGKAAIYERACADLGISLPTLHRKLRELTVQTKSRKRRADAGKSGLTRDEARLIAGVILESRRGTGKRLYSLNDAVDALRTNRLIHAESINPVTGEVRPLSYSAISRALRSFGLHPDQLSAPTPHVEMSAEHPNQVWQIDASLCVLYYLRPGSGPSGLHVMKEEEFNKNKPKNLARVMANRVWSYEITDHVSGWVYVQYVLGAESGENLCNVLISAMQERGGADMLHGVPSILYMDPGSANTSAMARNLCRSLGIQAIAHAPGVARATGQVENARNLIENKFEAGLRFRPVADLDELNALAAQWRAHFNATAKHRRHGMTRTACWMRITPSQLIKAPSVELCRELAVAEPESRKVKPNLRVDFLGAEWSVANVPGILVGERVLITRNPWRTDAAQVVTHDAEGREVFHVVPRIEKDTFGYATDAVRFGTYKSLPETQAQKEARAIEQILTGTHTDAEAQAQRKAKAIPLGGKFNPYKATEEAELPNYLPRRGQEHSLQARIEVPPLTHIAAAKRLAASMPGWSAEHMARLKSEFPNGVPEAELDGLAARLQQPARTSLRVVGGDA